MFFTQVMILALAALAATHPVHDEGEHLQVVETRVTRANTKRTLEDCAPYLEAQGVNARAMERRNATINAHRTAQGRPWEIVPYAMSNEFDAFSGVPRRDFGPAYIPEEHVRGDLNASEQNASRIFVMADIQLINVETCYPMADVWAEIWSCNETGLHSGIQSEDPWYPCPYGARDLNNTTPHSLQKSDADGVVQFRDTIPVHPGGTNHQHIVVHENATILPNGILAGGEKLSHVGQLSLDQALLDEIENMAPRNTNSEGFVFRRQETAGNDSDLIYNYALFGEDVTYGLLAWVVIGVDPSASCTPTKSSARTKCSGAAVANMGESGRAH